MRNDVTVGYPFLSNPSDVDGMEDAPSTLEPNWCDPHSLRLSDVIYFLNNSDNGRKQIFANCWHSAVFVYMICCSNSEFKSCSYIRVLSLQMRSKLSPSVLMIYQYDLKVHHPQQLCLFLS